MNSKQWNVGPTQLYPYCIYTTVAPERLARGGRGELVESKPWKTGWDLFQRAKAAGQDMAIVFSDAANDCSALIYWAIISEIQLSEKETNCSYRDLQEFPQGAISLKNSVYAAPTKR